MSHYTTVSFAYNPTKDVMSNIDEQTIIIRQSVANLDELSTIDLSVSFAILITHWWNSYTPGNCRIGTEDWQKRVN